MFERPQNGRAVRGDVDHVAEFDAVYAAVQLVGDLVDLIVRRDEFAHDTLARTEKIDAEILL